MKAISDKRIGLFIEYQWDGSESPEQYKLSLLERLHYLEDKTALAMEEVKDTETEYALGDVCNLITLIRNNI